MTTEELQIRQFLEKYQLRLNYYEKFDKVIKAYTNNGLFAIKSIPAVKGTGFVKNIQALYQSGYNRIVPVFQTVDQSYGEVVGKELWYLMPWLPNEHGELSERHQHLFRELARMHTLTVKDIPVTPSDREKHYQDMKQRMSKQLDFIDEFVRMAERKWYMSPFELQYCVYHNEISQAVQYAQKKLEEWFDTTKEDEKVRTVITHGKVSANHFLYADNGYGHFINLEDTVTAAPHYDLLPFIVKQLNTYPKQADDVINYIHQYLKFFPWKESEQLLFTSYLAYPENCLHVVDNYYHRSNQSEAALCRKLQSQYWLLKNTEYIIMKMEQAKEISKSMETVEAT